MGAETTWRDGLRAVAPLMVGVVPFAAIAGATAAAQGMDLPSWIAMNTVMFAGASQLAMLDLLGQGAPVLVAVIAALVINLRFLLYGRSLASRLGASKGRFAMAYLLTDQAFVVTSTMVPRDASPRAVRSFFFGAALPMWLVWQVVAIVGYRYGALIPASWQLEVAVPLTFLAMLAPQLRDSADARWAALVAGVVALAGSGIPMHLGLLVGIVAGMLAPSLQTSPLGPAEPKATDGFPCKPTASGGPSAPPTSAPASGRA